MVGDSIDKQAQNKSTLIIVDQLFDNVTHNLRTGTQEKKGQYLCTVPFLNSIC